MWLIDSRNFNLFQPLLHQVASGLVSESAADQGIDAYIATSRLPHGQPRLPKRGPLPRDADARTRMVRKLRSNNGSAIYAQR